jgi:hypothetical protein
MWILLTELPWDTRRIGLELQLIPPERWEKIFPHWEELSQRSVEPAKTGNQSIAQANSGCLKRASTWKGRWPAFLDLISESVKIVYYYARGWIRHSLVQPSWLRIR